MEAGRIIVVSPDDAFGKQLGMALTAAGGVVEYRGLDTLAEGAHGAALCVLVLGDDLQGALPAIAQLGASCRVIAVVPRASIASFLALMQASEAVVAMLAVEDFDARRLYTLATRILSGDLFGLAKEMKSGTQVQSQQVTDYHERTLCLAQVASFAQRMGVHPRTGSAIEQCLDEMLMNALYAAPVDTAGQRIFAGVPTKMRVTMHIEQTVEVQYACDGKQFALSVRDAFGSLDRATLLGFLYKCLHARQAVDRKAGGAGVGLYLLVNAATSVSFNVIPGVATEVMCTFDLEAPALRLAQLGFHLEATDITGTLVSARQPAEAMRPVPLRPPRNMRQPVLIAAAALSTLAVAGALWAVVRGRTPHGPPPAATVEIDSQPSGADVEITGQSVGETPVSVTTLGPDTDVAVVFKRKGYKQVVARLHVPPASQSTRLVQPLAVADDYVRVHFVTKPAGARIIDLDAPAPKGSRTYTPADVLVEANKPHRFMLTMPSHVPLVIDPFTPPPGTGTLEKGGTLVEGTALEIRAAGDGKVTVTGAPHCKDLAVPAACTVPPGRYVVTYVGAGGAKASRTVQVATEPTTVQFDQVVQAAPGN